MATLLIQRESNVTFTVKKRLNALITSDSNEAGTAKPEVTALLEYATKILQELLAEKARFLATLSRVMGDNYASQAPSLRDVGRVCLWPDNLSRRLGSI